MLNVFFSPWFALQNTCGKPFGDVFFLGGSGREEDVWKEKPYSDVSRQAEGRTD